MSPRKYDVRELASLPTLESGHFDNLKIETGHERVWLSRMTRADGACCEHHVTVERLVDGVWIDVRNECNDGEEANHAHHRD